MRGNQILSPSGHPLLLRGGQIEGVFNVAKPSKNEKLTIQDFPKIVKEMSQVWHMNTLRLPTCNWLWQADPTGFMSRLQTAVQQANAAGLYVIIEAHEDHRCDPPYNPYDVIHMPRPAVETYWHAVASTFKNDPMVIFDVYNEPAIRNVNLDQSTTADWQFWLHGGVQNGETFVGMQDLVNTIRATGAQQMIMVEGFTWGESFYNIGSNLINDPDIVYEVHDYGLNQPTTLWDKDFTFLTATHPVFVGEFGLMGGDNGGQDNCYKIQPSQADLVVLNFLGYLAAHNMGWSAYAFDLNHMLLDYTNFTPTTFDFNWTCGQSNPLPGMGTVVKQYLLSH